MNLSGSGPYGLVPRSTNTETLDMVGHADLVRVVASVWELPYAGVTPMDGIAVLRSTKECATVQLPEGNDQLLIIPLIGEVATNVESIDELTSTRLSEQATLLRRRAEGSSMKIEGEGTLLVLYRLKQQKTVEILKKA